MNDFLKRYQITLKTLTPVYIGSGEEFSKKEFVFYKKSKEALIPDLQSLFSDIRKRNLTDKFAKYMTEGKEPLLAWLVSMGYSNVDIEKLCSYKLDCSDALEQVNRPLGIQCFVKDPYGFPYIPGSSLKGALRNVLLAEDMIHHPEKYQRLKQKVQQTSPIRNGRPDRRYLQREGADAEQICFRKSDSDERNANNALNDNLKGLRISDSRPLAKEDLILCQKVDVGVAKNTNSINVLRESLKPGIQAEFEMVIDSSVLKLDIRKIEEAINIVSNFYVDVFVKHFMELPHVENEIYLGGGSGYGTKTVAYELLDSELLDSDSRLKVVSNIMDIRFWKHKHKQDIAKGVSPRMLKCTRYKGELCEMGRCQIKIEACGE